MAMPESHTRPEHYFEECIQFFDEYKYLYNFPNTDILVLNVLDKINISKLEDLIIDEKLDLETVKDTFLEEFFIKLNRLKPKFNDFHEDESIPSIMDVPLSPKKRHEIIYLSKEIKNICQETNCGVVVDFGSGLGYLDQQIYDTTSVSVLGLECNETNYVGAKKRQRRYHENSVQNVKYIKHNITEHSDITGFLDDKFPSETRCCVTGLHACADLALDAMRIFLRTAEAKAFILLPCCYHKRTRNLESFKNFPLSNCLKDIYNKHKGFEFINVPFLRLAAQHPSPAPRRPRRLDDSVFHIAARAALQLYAFRHNCTLKRNKRKPVNVKTMENNFENYIQDAFSHGFRLIKNEPCIQHNKDENVNVDMAEMVSMWRQMSQLTVKKVGIFILLQDALQPVFENFVLFDSLVYIKENGINNCRFKRIFDENTSPRCLALLAYK